MKTVLEEIYFDLAHNLDADNSIQEDFIAKQLRLTKRNDETTPSKIKSYSIFNSNSPHFNNLLPMATLILVRGKNESKEVFDKRVHQKEKEVIFQSVEHRGDRVIINYFESLNKNI